MELCNRLLHKFREVTILFFWIRLLMQMSVNGILKNQRKMAGLAMSLSIRLKAACISGRFWRIRSRILSVVCHLHRVSWQRRL